MRAGASTRAATLVRRARQARHRLQIVQPALANEPARAHSRLVDALSSERVRVEPSEEDALIVLECWGNFVHSLARLPLVEPAPGLSAVDRWGRHLLESLLLEENPFSRLAQAVESTKRLPVAICQIVASDLAELHWLFKCDSAFLAGEVSRIAHRAGLEDHLDPLSADFSLARRRSQELTPVEEASLRFAQSESWSELVGCLADFHLQNGAGLFACHHAFRWVADDGGRLEGVAEPDPIRLSELIGYDTERQLLLENTEQFVAGFTANNVLLYGDRGAGKSATVKALFNQFRSQGLRLIELPKNRLTDLPRLIPLLRGRRERFIIFIDDLSFEEQETDYKELKALLEGGLETRPENVLLYATSNRRHLVAERFDDREAFPDEAELRWQDTLQQKLSLSDRFGITAIFLTPDQERYLQIVEGLAGQRGLNIEREELRRQALQWASWHNGRSGRTARQFVDQLAGRLAYEASRSAKMTATS